MAHIQPVFPTPLYIDNIDNEITNEVINFINKFKLKDNRENLMSEVTYVLDEPIFQSFKIKLIVMLKEYLNRVLGVDLKKVQPIITQSWLNFNKKGSSHHAHCHPNSIVSGVIYLAANRQYDSINFHKQEYSSLKMNLERFTEFNCDKFSWKVGKGDIILFPSSLVHSVSPNTQDQTRVSLSFNTFIKGSLGYETELNKLTIL